MADYKNLVEMQEDACKKFKNKPLFGTKRATGYEWINYGEFGVLVDQMRAGLASLGVEAGNKIAIISKNSYEWASIAYASYGRSAHYVPMYEDQLIKDWVYTIEDSGAKVLFVSTDEIFEKVKNLPNEIDFLEHVININGSKNDSNSYLGLLEAGKANPVDSIYPDIDEPMGLIYTSGTTGKPKGVVLSHGNILSNVNSMNSIIDVEVGDRSLSFLPWAHVFGQTVEVHCLISSGYSAGLVDDVSKIVDRLAEIKPTILVSVPRIFNKIYDAVATKMKDEGGLAEFLFNKGMDVATRKKQNQKVNFIDNLLYMLADKIVFSKIRGKFGGNLKYAISGASALSKEVGQFIDNLGIIVYEGYGLSETSPMVCANSKSGRKIGTVGRTIPNVRVVLDKTAVGEDSNDGEIVVYGPNVMKGYHNLPDETAAVMTEDGGFRTGDLGSFDNEGFLKITGRIKEQYKLENGKYVVPSPIEEKLQLSQYINQALIYGDNKIYNVAIIIPAIDNLKKYAAEQGIPTNDVNALLNNAQILDLFKSELETYSQSIKSYERPRKFALFADEWTPENGLMTPTLKLKRKLIVDKHQELLNSLY
ncbi:MAG: long-chain acyl-CoA synthetase [bacterium]|jgi:long-chain acyl-CoA synthetase